MSLREAAQQAVSALELAQTDVHWELNSPTRKCLRKAEKALRAALAEPQEPVVPSDYADSHQPVAWRYKPMIGSPWSLSDDGYYISCKRDKGYTVEPLYTAPPQRKPLTEEEIRRIYETHRASVPLYHAIARAIERAHGIGGQDE